MFFISKNNYPNLEIDARLAMYAYFTNNFQTSVRGIKVRGVYESKQEAHDKAKALTIKSSAFHTFIGQVGYWLPWDPNADKIQDEVYQNSELNTMMEQYEENNVNRDIFYGSSTSIRKFLSQSIKIGLQLL